MTTAIERVASSGALALASDQHDWTPEQAAALTQLGLDDASPADLKVFLHQSQRTGLDPFARQIYMIGRWDNRAGRKKFTIQSSIDGLRIVAERHGQYGGQLGPEWCGDDGVWHDVWVSNKPPTAARVGVVRKDWAQPLYATALFREYAAFRKDGSLEPMWQTKSCHMIAKVSEALALRKAFPHDLSGIYTSDEMAQADNPPLRVVIDQDADPEPAATPTPAAAPTDVDWDAEIAKCGADRDALLALFNQAPNAEVQAKIIEAAKKSGVAKPKPAAEEPLTVDAEIVDAPPARKTTQDRKTDTARQTLAGVTELLDISTPTKAGVVHERLQKESHARRTDVSGILSVDAREVLGVADGDKVTLVDLAALVLDYVDSHGYSVNTGIDGGPSDHSGGTERTLGQDGAAA